MKSTTKRENKSNSLIFLLLICIATLFMSVGYAKIGPITSEIKGKLIAEAQDGIFVTDVSYKENVNAEATSSTIIPISQNIVKTNIVLSDVNKNSSITYNVTVFNKFDIPYRFVGVAYDSEFYSNNNIVFELSGIESGDTILSKHYLTFSITFKYLDNVDMNDESFSSVLNSILNFDFERDVIPVLANKMIPVYHESGEWKKTSSSSSNWHDYYNGKWANAITYDHELVHNNVEKSVMPKSFDGKSDYYSFGNVNVDFPNGFSIVIRFKLDTLNSTEYFIFGNAERAGFGLLKNPNNELAFAIYNQNKGGYSYMYANLVLETDVWYTVAATHDGNTAKLYVNGELNNSATVKCDYLASKAPIVLGANPGSTTTKPINGSYFDGVISEAVIFSKILNESDIASCYNKVINHNYNASNVLNHIKFDCDNAHLKNGAYYTADGVVFDGENDYIPIGYSNYNFNKSITVGARFKLDQLNSSNKTIVGNVNGNTGFQIAINTSNQVIFVLRNSKNTPYAASTFTLSAGVWYTVVATYDGNNIKLYINGTLNNTTNATGVITMSSASIGISGRLNPTNINSSYFVDGVISDIIIVDEALTANQISTYYSSNLREVVSDKTLISYDLRSYEERVDGTIIPEEMIKTMWVWIPRFKADTPTSLGTIKTKIVGVNESAHDAFTLGGEELQGFWVGKYENSASFASENADNTIFIKPNNNSWTQNSIGGMFNSIKNIALLPGKYGFDTNETKTLDTHMIKNNEWGAIAYFSHGNCGISREGTYIEIGDSQSTTGNDYGVYQMAGGANEFVMGNYNNTANTYFEILPESKYYNVYTTQEQYTNNKLQHALFETNDYNTLTQNFVDNTNIWLIRNGLFSYTNSTGASNSNIGSRSVLIVK